MAEPAKTAIERRLYDSLEDTDGVGKPLSRRARQTRRTVEAYLKGGGVPRYMERLNEIDSGVRMQTARLESAYRRLQAAHRDDPELFAKRWRERAHGWRFERLNELIRDHNAWYPIETGLPMDPRTGDYIRRAGRSYRRAELTPEWVLERFPACVTGAPAYLRRGSHRTGGAMTQTEARQGVRPAEAGASASASAELARRFIEALNARDVDGLRALVTDYVEFRNRQGRSFHGHDGVRDVVRAADDASVLLTRAGDEHVEDGGERVSVPVNVVVGRDKIAGTAVFDVRDGKVAGFEVITEQ
jgi:hypothetical protein